MLRLVFLASHPVNPRISATRGGLHNVGISPRRSVYADSNTPADRAIAPWECDADASPDRPAFPQALNYPQLTIEICTT